MHLKTIHENNHWQNYFNGNFEKGELKSEPFVNANIFICNNRITKLQKDAIVLSGNSKCFLEENQFFVCNCRFLKSSSLGVVNIKFFCQDCSVGNQDELSGLIINIDASYSTSTAHNELNSVANFDHKQTSRSHIEYYIAGFVYSSYCNTSSCSSTYNPTIKVDNTFHGSQISNCIYASNSANNVIFSVEEYSNIVSNCIFVKNKIDLDVFGMFVVFGESTKAIFKQCSFSQNEGTGYLIRGYSTCILVQCYIQSYNNGKETAGCSVIEPISRELTFAFPFVFGAETGCKGRTRFRLCLSLFIGITLLYQ